MLGKSGDYNAAASKRRTIPLITILIVVSILIVANVTTSTFKALTQIGMPAREADMLASTHKQQRPSAASSADASLSSSSTFLNVMVISTSNNVNRNSLQQQQEEEEQQQQYEKKGHQASGSVDKDSYYHYNSAILDNARSALGTAGRPGLRGVTAVAAAGENGAEDTAASTNAAGDNARNGFLDKINISNQRNEFNGRSTDSSAASSYFAEQPPELEAADDGTDALVQAERRKLLLHRQKRYLLFPEGSSFQLVFDLIIPIVDYNNFAIMGITCAVAWELPSKPPSEIIENFRDKLNDGTFGLSRRNDSATNRIYVDDDKPIVSPASPKSPASAASTPTDSSRQSIGQLTSPVGAYNGHGYLYAPPVGYTGYYAHPRQPSYPTAPNYGWYSGNTISGGGGGDSSSTSAYTSTDKLGYAPHDWQRQRSDTAAPHTLFPQRPQHQQQHQDYNKYENNWPTEGDSNWWARNKQRVQSNWRAKQHDWAYKYGRAQQPPGTAYVAPNSDKRFESGTTAARYGTVADNGGDGGGSGDATRTGRGRKILVEPPRHRIYPVFGRKRRHTSLADGALDAPDELELQMERIHLREHLRTRQKLYGQIEKLFTTNGHNGTACVLRALCETGQRQQQQQQQQQHQHQRQHRHRQQRHQASEPQSFITELLRAIFVLPKDRSQDEAAKELHTHIDAHYRLAHGHTGDCAALYDVCPYSVWSDFEFKS